MESRVTKGYFGRACRLRFSENREVRAESSRRHTFTPGVGERQEAFAEFSWVYEDREYRGRVGQSFSSYRDTQRNWDSAGGAFAFGDKRGNEVWYQAPPENVLLLHDKLPYVCETFPSPNSFEMASFDHD